MSTNPNILKTDAATMAKLFPPEKRGEPRTCKVCFITTAAAAMHSQFVCNSCNAEKVRQEKHKDYKPPVEQRWNDIKAQRDHLLNASLWAVVPDSPLTAQNRVAFNNYRKSLHRITVDFATPDDVVWPTQPGMVFEKG